MNYTFSTILSFNVPNGANPYAGLISDASGDLFGTTVSGGSSNTGTVFEIPWNGSSYGPLTPLVSFNVPNGANPYAGLISDASGDLFGTTYAGGSSSQGTVFEVFWNGSSYGPLTTLVNFNGSNGANPDAGLIRDASGNLFGTTVSGGSSNTGTVFEIPWNGSSYGPLTTLVNFSFSNGGHPEAGLITDASGDLFGTTVIGGSSSQGTVFEIPWNGSSYGPLTTLVTSTVPTALIHRLV